MIQVLTPPAPGLKGWAVLEINGHIWDAEFPAGMELEAVAYVYARAAAEYAQAEMLSRAVRGMGQAAARKRDEMILAALTPPAAASESRP